MKSHQMTGSILFSQSAKNNLDTFFLCHVQSGYVVVYRPRKFKTGLGQTLSEKERFNQVRLQPDIKLSKTSFLMNFVLFTYLESEN